MPQVASHLISEEDFINKYHPVEDEDGCADYAEWEEAKTWPRNEVWTIVEGDDDGLYAQAGFHIVNKIGYIRTFTPWKTGDEEAVWFEAPGPDLAEQALHEHHVKQGTCDFCHKRNLTTVETRDTKLICQSCADKLNFCEVCGSWCPTTKPKAEQLHYDELCFK